MLRVIDRSLLLLLTVMSVALLALWLRSHIVGDFYRWVELAELEGGGLMMRSGDLWTGEGGVALRTQRQTATDPAGQPLVRRSAERRVRWAPTGYTRLTTPSYPVRSGDGVLAPLGINIEVENRSINQVDRSNVEIALPLWMVIVVTGTYPLLRFIRGVIRREREERILLGLCPRCGIDVRSGPERCPSCGKRQPLILPQRIAA